MFHCRLFDVTLLMLLFPIALSAQSVRGFLMEEESGRPIAGALVLLLDTAGKRQGAALTDATGSFLLTAPAPARYTVRAERVGHASAISPTLDLRGGQIQELRLAAPTQPVALEGISVEGRKRRCSVRPESALETARVWEEARKVLTSAAWTQEASLYRFEVTHHERDLDARSLQVHSERRNSGTTRARHPFASIPAGTLSERGFVQTTSNGTYYYAPDAEVLLSDKFMDDHCYRIEARGDSLIGLAFEPIPGRDVPEIRGVLWLHRKTAELHHLEYGYVNLPVSVPTDKLGGRVEFRRLPTGAWIVERWALRMPQVSLVDQRGLTVGGMPAERRHEQRLAGIREVGGEVTGTFTRDGARVKEVPRMTVAGVVFDSASATPLSGAMVFLSGTQFSATTDDEGRFVLEGVPEGEYLAAFSHPVLESAEAPPAPRSVTVRRGEATTVALTVPPLRVATRTPPKHATTRVVAVEGVRVVGRSEFERRARSGSGRYITRADIERERPHATTEIFRRLPGVEVIGGTIRLRGAGTPFASGLSALTRAAPGFPGDTLRAGSSGSGGTLVCRGGPGCEGVVENESRKAQADRPADCVPTFYLDGAEWQPIGGDLNSLRPEDIEGIEVYARPSLAPGQYKKLDSECGIILIWTRDRDGKK
jgi:hypothetical protein